MSRAWLILILSGEASIGFAVLVFFLRMCGAT
jgi:hypothetical protein